MAHNSNNNTAQTAAAWTFAALCAAFGLWRLRYGLSFSDEGFNLASPLRYALGDTPFRDEVLNPLRWYDIFASPIIARLPDQGAVLLLRHAALASRIICSAALVWTLKKHLRPPALTAIFAAALFSNIFTYWTPTYHSASFDFITLAAAALILSVTRGSIPFGIAAGAALGAAWCCELPALALAAVPAAATAALLRNRNYSKAAAPAASIAVTALALAAAYSLLRAHGLLPHLISALKIQTTVQQYGGGAQYRLAWLAAETARALPWAALHTALLAAALKTKQNTPARAAVAALGLIPPALILAKLDYFVMASYMEGLLLLIIVYVPAVAISPKSQWTTGARPACLVLYATGIIWHYTLAMAAGSGMRMGVVLSFPFLLAAGLLAARAAQPENKTGQGARPPFDLAAIALAAALIAANLYSVHDAGWIWNMDSQFKTGKLRGIKLYEYHTASTEALTGYLADKVKPGDTLLAFYDAPMINYLTETRPALRTSLPSRNWSPAVRAGFIAEMERRGRAPQYAVNLGGVDPADPIYKYIAEKYAPAARIGPYIIWNRRAAPAVR